jgi:hypothetical protein
VLKAKYNKPNTLSQELEQGSIKISIEKVREQLLETWDKCLKSEQERAIFTALHSNVFTKDLLALHEMELEELTIFYEENHEVFKLLKERQDLLDRKEISEYSVYDLSKPKQNYWSLSRSTPKKNLLEPLR